MLLDTEFVLGRSSYCTLPLLHASVSRLHAALLRRGNLIFLRDLGSRNGTWLYGQRIEGEVLVSSGMQFRVGDVNVTLVRVAMGPVVGTTQTSPSSERGSG